MNSPISFLWRAAGVSLPVGRIANSSYPVGRVANSSYPVGRIANSSYVASPRIGNPSWGIFSSDVRLNRSSIQLLRIGAFLLVICLGLSAELGAQLLQPVSDSETVPTEIQAIYKLTQSATATADYEHIIQRCEKLLEKEIGDKDRKYLNRLIGWAQNRCAEKYIQNATALMQMGLTDQAEEQRQLGIAKFDDVIQNHPLNWRAWMGRAQLHVQQGQYESALEKFRQVTRLNNRNKAAWFNCAEIGFQLKMYDQAIADYSRLIADDPTDIQSRTGRGHCYFATQQLEFALDDYRTVINLRPDDSIALCNAGDAHMELKQWSDAKSRFESATKMAESGLGLQRLAEFHLNCPDHAIADPKMAIGLINRAIDRDGTLPGYLQTLAAAYRATGQFQLAEQTLTQAKTSPDSESRLLPTNR